MASLVTNRNRIRVVARFRPLQEAESTFGADKIVQYSTNLKSVGIKGQIFSYDRVFDHHASQHQVYDLVAEPVVRDFLKGYNGTILSYGQTGAGKTYTMQGTAAQPGVIPRALDNIFAEISTAGASDKCQITVSFYEIYMEKIYDLLDTSKRNLKIRQTSERAVTIENLTERPIESKSQALEVYKLGTSNRTTAETKMNLDSSRSHAVFVITMTKEHPEDNSRTRSVLNLVDLAGSEKIAKSGSEGAAADEAKKINLSLTNLGKVIHALTENQRISDIFVSPGATPVHSSMLADRTNNVISPPVSPTKQERRHFYVSSSNTPASPAQALLQANLATAIAIAGATSPPSIPRSVTTPCAGATANLNPPSTPSVKHVPYRESKLTRVLSESLGGNSRTCLILQASPSLIHDQETISTLRFGQRAKLVKNDVFINRTGPQTPPKTPSSAAFASPSLSRTNTAQLLQTLYTKVDSLQQQLDFYQRKEVTQVSSPFSPQPHPSVSAQMAALSESVQELQAERDTLRLDNERLLLLLEDHDAGQATNEKISQLVLYKNAYIEEARMRQEDKLEELEEILADYKASRLSLEDKLADKLAEATSSSSIGSASTSFGDAAGSIELTQVSLLLTQNEELYRSNESLKLNVEVMRQMMEEKDKQIRRLEAQLRNEAMPDEFVVDYESDSADASASDISFDQQTAEVSC